MKNENILIDKTCWKCGNREATSDDTGQATIKHKSVCRDCKKGSKFTLHKDLKC